MALAYTSDNIANEKYTPSSAPHSAREVYRAMGTVLTTANLVINNLIGLCVLPANCIPTGITIVSTDLDAGAGLEYDVGILNEDKDDLVADSKLITGSDVGQEGGVADMDTPDCAFAPATWLAQAACPGYDADHASAAINSSKIVALKVSQAPATPVASGTIYARLDYRSAENGV